MHRDFVAVLARMRRGGEMLATILDPAQRLPYLARQSGECEFLRIEVVLDAKATANFRRHDTQFALFHLQAMRKRGTDDVRKLGRAVDHKFACSLV